MYGAIIGDIVGSQFEFDRGNKSREFEFFSKECKFTDDTVMTVAVAEALLDTGKDADEKTIKEELVRSLKKWGKAYPRAGYGNRFKQWVLTDKSEPYGSYGNGSAMRVSPAGWLYDSMERTREVARWTAEITHNHPEGVKGAESTAAAIFMARKGATLEEIRDYIAEEFGYDLSRTLDEIRPDYKHVEDCMRTMPEAFECFLEADSYESCIRNVMYIGGDTDTLGAIAGAIAEAYWGVPDELIKQAEKYIPDEIRDVIYRFLIEVKPTELEKLDIFKDPDAFINETVEAALSELTEEDKKALLDNPDPLDHHFGYGMYIRNRYIHGKKHGLIAMDKDSLSAQIVEEIIKRLQEEAER